MNKIIINMIKIKRKNNVNNGIVKKTINLNLSD